jgi:hypothetical protein
VARDSLVKEKRRGVFESAILLTLLFTAFMAYQNYSLGLTATVPKDPSHRVHWQAAQCLETLKSKLSGATIVEMAESRVVFHGQDSNKSTLWSEGGQVLLEVDGQPKSVIHSLGDSGLVTFKQLSPTAIFAKIVADTGTGASHEVGVRLEVKPA